jgi:hypothetical protein
MDSEYAAQHASAPSCRLMRTRFSISSIGTSACMQPSILQAAALCLTLQLACMPVS